MKFSLEMPPSRLWTRIKEKIFGVSSLNYVYVCLHFSFGTKKKKWVAGYDTAKWAHAHRKIAVVELEEMVWNESGTAVCTLYTYNT